MKTISNIYILALILLTLDSCDDFLDIKPVGKVIPETAQDFREVMTDAYKSIPNDRSLSTVRGDELQLNFDDWGGGHLPYQSIFTWEDLSNDENAIEFPWQSFYKSILDANQVLLDGENMTEGEKMEIEQLRGEAYMMRAYIHFNLVNLFADVYSKKNLQKKAVPLATTIDIWKNYKRNTLGEVYEQIIKDLQNGIALLNIDEQKKGYNYRFSKISAYGFAARVYLYMGNWVKAKEYAEKAYAINNHLEDLSLNNAKLPQNFESVENVLAMEQTFYYELKSKFSVSEKLLSAFDSDNDLRFVKYFEKSGSIYKCRLGNKLENKVSMRTAEFYLILAEAEAQLDNLDNAKKYLLSLIEKRLTPVYFANQKNTIEALNKIQFLERVKEERFRELACQGFRWYDLRRYGKPALEKTFEGKTYKLQKGDPRYILRFPEEAVSNNPNLINE